ncbi:MAG: hypothetical protein NTY96_08660 [Bacteroidetes bacterium]|nr:hypothetical protein [Bacteroidota bacterium]
MPQTETADNQEFGKISEKLARLEERLSALEDKVLSGSRQQSLMKSIEDAGFSGGETVSVDETTIESNILEYGLSWIGIVVLLFGIGFLMMFIQKQMGSYFSSFIGYIAVAGVYTLSRYLKNSHEHLAYMLNIGTHLLLFFVTMRLYFFSSPQVIPFKEAVVFLLLIVIGFQLYRSTLLKSELLASIAVFLILATSVFCDTTHESLPMLTIAAATSFWLFYRYGWWRQMIFSIIAVYLSHILWLMGNPVMGHPIGGIQATQFNLIYLFSYGMIFSLTPLVKQDERFKANVYSSSVLVNGIFFFLVLMLDVLLFYMKSYSGIFAGVFIACLAYSIFLKFRTERVFDSAFYAIFSFLALSAAVYGYTGLPGAYFFLSLQSVLVVSWALWFRSQFIVVVNTILFVGMLLVYMISGTYLDTVNFTFALSAFLTARIINWQKMRLELKTENFRTIYLFCLFFTFAFALYKVVPSQYVTPSWTGAAILYFILSLVLKNRKYRWMAIAMLLITAVYLFVVDLAHMEVGYRVIAFLFLAVVLFGTSLYFTKFLRKKKTQASEE